ncbi:MAG TPA: class I SAM-dependent methyltransferase [Mycobacteriales bacterium]|nr:class I SAM-dependent methyltransferase [Mycobacteriales bacterium]
MSDPDRTWGRHSGGAFDALADDYDAARPRYPQAIFAALPPLAGATVFDVGAGTGIASRRLAAAGARVIAVDLGAGMLARLRSRTPTLPAVVAVGEALPFPARCADLVTYAQAWHWVDVATASAEASRVLRPGGTLAVWWNDVPAGLDWYDAQQDRLEAAVPGYTRGYRVADYGAQLTDTGVFASVEPLEVRWERRIDLPTYERWLRSKSYVAQLGTGVEAFVAAEMRQVAAVFPAGEVTEPFTARLWLARVPG